MLDGAVAILVLGDSIIRARRFLLKLLTRQQEAVKLPIKPLPLSLTASEGKNAEWKASTLMQALSHAGISFVITNQSPSSAPTRIKIHTSDADSSYTRGGENGHALDAGLQLAKDLGNSRPMKHPNYLLAQARKLGRAKVKVSQLTKRK